MSSNGLTINQHFCAGELMAAALFFKAEPCEHQSVPMTCCERKAAAQNLKTCSANKTKKCCDEKVIIVKVQDEGRVLWLCFQSIMPTFVAIMPIAFLFPKTNTLFFTPKYTYYKPPLLYEKEIAILYQVFLC